MNHLVQGCYDRAPSVVQTMALNAFGLMQRRRFSTADRVARSFAASERWSAEQQMAYVAERLRGILLHAVEYVPRYRSLGHLVRGLRDPTSDVFALLAEFPTVSRDEVAQRPNEFMSRAFRRHALHATVTSGTTGSPLRVWVEPVVEGVNDGLLRRRDLWAGYRNGDWIARLVGDPVVPRKVGASGVPYRVSWTDRRLYLSTYHLSRETALEFADVLETRRPEFLMGYPSALEALSRWGGRNGGKWRPKAVLFSSEPLYEHQREVIQSYVSAPLRGYYGCAERVVSAAQCEFGAYHLSLVDGYVEGQFDAAGVSPTPTGAKTPVTTLLNRAMPLIRYILGDTLSLLHHEACACGRTLPILSPVVTKAEDMVVTPSGRLISPSILTWAFKDLPGLQRSQVMQTGVSSLEVLVVVDDGNLSYVQSLLADRIRSMVFGEMTVTVKSVPSIAMTAGGKTRFVVNNYSRCAHTPPALRPPGRRHA